MGVVQSAISALSDTRSRLRMMMVEKGAIVNRARVNVFEYLLEGKFELARIEADDWVQKECAFNAYELLEKICEKLSQELPEMYSKNELSRAQADHAGTIIWAADRFRAELPELQGVADFLKEMYEGCRDGTYGVNSELVFFVNAANEPSLSMVMQRLLDVTSNMADEERDIARLGIEQCMATYADGASIDSIAPPRRPRTARPSTARRPSSAVVMPPPYDPSTFKLPFPPP